MQMLLIPVPGPDYRVSPLSGRVLRSSMLALGRLGALGLMTLVGLAVLTAPAMVRAQENPKPAAGELPDYAALLTDPVRSTEDRQADARRRPLELLRFAQVRPGMKVLDLAAGGGYTTQLLALAVGSTGRVWAQVPKRSSALDKRLAAHPQANIQLLERSFEAPYPSDAPRLDLITFILNYHDVANEKIDRALMNRRLYLALKPGGHLIVIDHSAQAGSGLRDTRTLHRIDESVVLAELQAAGFALESRSSFLANPADPREQAFFDRREATDRFALRLVRTPVEAGASGS